MYKLLLLATLIIYLISCSSSPTDGDDTPQQENSRLYKRVCVNYDNNWGVDNIYTTRYLYDQQNRLITEVSDQSSTGIDSVRYRYNGTSTLPAKIIRKNSYDNNYTIQSLHYDEINRVASFFTKQYNQGVLSYSDSADFSYNGNIRPAQVVHYKNFYDNSGAILPSYMQYFYNGDRLIKAISPGSVREIYYLENRFNMQVNHNANLQDTTFVETIEYGLIKKISTRNNHNGLLSWDFKYDAQDKIVEKREFRDSILAYRYTFSYNSTYQLLNRKIYRNYNNSEYLTEYQYDYENGATNKNEINRINKLIWDYAEGAITEFLPWQQPDDLYFLP